MKKNKPTEKEVTQTILEDREFATHRLERYIAHAEEECFSTYKDAILEAMEKILACDKRLLKMGKGLTETH